MQEEKDTKREIYMCPDELMGNYTEYAMNEVKEPKTKCTTEWNGTNGCMSMSSDSVSEMTPASDPQSDPYIETNTEALKLSEAEEVHSRQHSLTDHAAEKTLEKTMTLLDLEKCCMNTRFVLDKKTPPPPPEKKVNSCKDLCQGTQATETTESQSHRTASRQYNIVPDVTQQNQLTQEISQIKPVSYIEMAIKGCNAIISAPELNPSKIEVIKDKKTGKIIEKREVQYEKTFLVHKNATSTFSIRMSESDVEKYHSVDKDEVIKVVFAEKAEPLDPSIEIVDGTHWLVIDMDKVYDRTKGQNKNRSSIPLTGWIKFEYFSNRSIPFKCYSGNSGTDKQGGCWNLSRTMKINRGDFQFHEFNDTGICIVKYSRKTGLKRKRSDQHALA